MQNKLLFLFLAISTLSFSQIDETYFDFDDCTFGPWDLNTEGNAGHAEMFDNGHRTTSWVRGNVSHFEDYHTPQTIAAFGGSGKGLVLDAPLKTTEENKRPSRRIHITARDANDIADGSPNGAYDKTSWMGFAMKFNEYTGSTLIYQSIQTGTVFTSTALEMILREEDDGKDYIEVGFKWMYPLAGASSALPRELYKFEVNRDSWYKFVIKYIPTMDKSTAEWELYVAETGEDDWEAKFTKIINVKWPTLNSPSNGGNARTLISVGWYSGDLPDKTFPAIDLYLDELRTGNSVHEVDPARRVAGYSGFETEDVGKFPNVSSKELYDHYGHINEGVRKLRFKHSSKFLGFDGENAVQTNLPNATFDIKYAEDGFGYYMINCDGKALDLESNTDTANVVLNNLDPNKPTQRWHLIKDGLETYIKNMSTGNFITVDGESKDTGANIIQSTSYNGESNKRMYLSHASWQNNSLSIVNEGSYYLQFKHSQLLLTAQNGAGEKGSPLVQDEPRTDASQLFYLLRNNNTNEYLIYSADSEVGLELKGWSGADGADIGMWKINASNATHNWIFERVDGDFTRIKSKYSNKYVSVQDGLETGMSVVQKGYEDNDNQIIKLIPCYESDYSKESVTISANANPGNGGSISGAGSYNSGTTASLTAIAESGYDFVNWTENGVPVSTNANYSFTVTSSRTLAANFEVKTYTISASANPSSGGSISGVGSYNSGTTANLTATAESDYDFVNWTENGVQVSTNANYSFPVNSNRTLVANFEVKTYTVSANANPSSSGSISGVGSYNSGTTASLKATAESDYDFVNWTENGVQVSTDANYSFTVNSNRTLIANFESTVSVWDISEKIVMSIYPNPTSDYVKISTDASHTLSNARIIDINGRLVMQKQFSIGEEQIIYISNLEPGFYFLSLDFEGVKVDKKIIVQ